MELRKFIYLLGIILSLSACETSEVSEDDNNFIKNEQTQTTTESNNDLNIEGGSSSEIIVGDFNKDGIIELHHNEADKFRTKISLEFIDNKFQLVKRITN